MESRTGSKDSCRRLAKLRDLCGTCISKCIHIMAFHKSWPHRSAHLANQRDGKVCKVRGVILQTFPTTFASSLRESSNIGTPARCQAKRLFMHTAMETGAVSGTQVGWKLHREGASFPSKTIKNKPVGRFPRPRSLLLKLCNARRYTL